MTSYLHSPCGAPGCRNSGRERSRFCAMHEGHIIRHGWHGGRVMREEELKPYAADIAAGLSRYANRKAVQWAYAKGDEVLNYSPTWPVVSSEYVKAAELLTMIRHQGITGRELVLRVCIVHAFIAAHPERYPGTRSERIGIARGTLRVVTPNYARPSSRSLEHVGDVIQDHLGQFVGTFLRRLDDDVEASRRAISKEAFDEVAS